MLQIDRIASDPVSSTLALVSLICGLMNLLYGTALYIQFSYIKPVDAAALWSKVASRPLCATTDINSPRE